MYHDYCLKRKHHSYVVYDTTLAARVSYISELKIVYEILLIIIYGT